MNINQKVKDLKDKISSLDFNFSQEEKYMLSSFPELLNYYENIIVNNIEKTTMEDLHIITENETDEHNIDIRIIDRMIELWIEEGYCFTTANIDEFISSFENGKVLNKYKEKCIDVTKDFDSLLKKDEQDKIHEDIYTLLLDNKRYDILQKVCLCNIINDSIKERLLKEFPFDQYKEPEFINWLTLDDLLKIDSKHISLKRLLISYYNEHFSDTNKINPTSPLYRIIIEKLKDPNEELKADADEFISPLVSISNEDRNEEIYHLLSSKKSLSFLSEQKEYENISIEEIKERFKYHIINDIEIPDSFYELKSISDEVLSDHSIMNLLLTNDELYILLKSPIIDEYIPKIKERIISNPNNYTDIQANKYNGLKKYPEILKLFINYKGYCFLDLDMDDEIPNDVIELFIKEGTCNSIRLSRNAIEKNIDLIIDRINNDLEYAIKFEKEYLSLLRSKPEILNKLIQVYLQIGDLFINKIKDFIVHNGDIEILTNEENYKFIREYICKTKKLDIEHMDKIESLFGPRIISYFNNETICELINLSDEDFNKIIEIFKIEEYKMSDVEAVYDSIKQHRYQIESPKIFSVFNDILHSLQDGTNDYEISMEAIKEYLDESFIKEFNKYTDLQYELKDIDHILNLIINKIKENNPEKIEKYTTLLHFITSYFIKEKREEYRTKYDLHNEIKLDEKIDPKKNERILMTMLLKKSEIIDLLFHDLVTEDFDETLLKDCINYFNDKNARLINDQNLVRSNIRILSMYLKNYINNLSEEEKIEIIKETETIAIKYDYEVDKPKRNPYEILSSINIKALQKNIINNEKIYEALLNIMKKKKLMTIPNSIGEFINSCEREFDQIDVAVFVTYFYKIYEEEVKRTNINREDNKEFNMSFSSVLDYMEAFGSFSSIYRRTLGEEDARLIKANPNPNSAYNSNEKERLNISLERTIKNFERTAVAIPTFNEELECGNDKKLRVICGNFTHPSNLTHGERTGACMRIGGVGQSLYDFCLDSEFGFHIRFENPETGEYISRVSGFRNGNTVFLNELRCSCNRNDYNDKEIEKACEEASKMIVELSKDSEVPIDNVVIHRAYAMVDSDKKECKLDIINNKEGLDNFYSDVRNYAIIMATTEEPFKKVNLGTENIPRYLPAREKTKTITNEEELLSYIYRIEQIKKYHETGMFDFIDDILFEDGLLIAKANQDWYVYVDNNKVIHSDIITNDYRAQEELRSAIEELSKKYGIGGDKHEL